MNTRRLDVRTVTSMFYTLETARHKYEVVLVTDCVVINKMNKKYINYVVMCLFHFLIMQWWSLKSSSNHKCRPTHGTVRKSHRTFIVTIYLLDNNSKTTSFLFLFQIITKLEWTQSNAFITEQIQTQSSHQQWEKHFF